MRNLTLLSCLFLFIACNSSDGGAPASSSTDATASQAASSSSGKIYEEGLRKQPCMLLTADMVAAVVQVPVDQVEQRELSTMCLYEWEGGNAGILFIETHETADKARTLFENAHKSMTGAEVKSAMQQIGEGAKEKLAGDEKAGQEVPDAEHVDTVTDAMSGSMGGGITFEAVTGLGDMAAYETTRHETKIGDRVLVSYANKLDVLTGNLSFDISFAFDNDGGDAQMYQDEAVALARAVLDGLPR